MNAISKLFFKSFLYIASIYLIISSLLDYSFMGETNWEKLIYTALFIGIVPSIYMISETKRKLKKCGVTEFNNENLSLNQSRVIKSELDFDNLILSLKQNKPIQNMKITHSDSNSIYIKSPMTLYSWGEKIFIRLKSKNGNLNEYEVSSKPSFALTLVDYGKNFTNIVLIEMFLKNEGKSNKDNSALA